MAMWISPRRMTYATPWTSPRSLSSRGDVILLSPACSSFDEFSGYEERGRVFKDYVAQLAAAAKSQME